MLGAIVTCPLEVVKTRLQAKGNKDNLVSKFRFGLGTYNALKYTHFLLAHRLQLTPFEQRAFENRRSKWMV